MAPAAASGRIAAVGRTGPATGRRHGLSRLGIAALPLSLILFVAVGFRLAPWLAGHPLHHDEALYGTWARLIASGRDPLLLSPWIDKPPLAIYAMAASLRAFGISELALRLPGLLAGVATAGAAFALARRAYGIRTALLTGLLVAASPFAILFAPTAFTDPWLVLWLTAAAWAAVAGRSALAGLLLGLAVASKQQGVLGIPLVIALLAWAATRRRDRRSYARQLALSLGLAIAGAAVVIGPLTWWDSLRWSNRPSFWDRSLATYGGLVLASPVELPVRAVDWAVEARYLYGVPLLSAVLLAAAAATGFGAAACLVRKAPLAGRASPERRLAWLDLILSAYAAAYLLLHVVVTFQPWDRYLLPLVPLVALLAARAIDATLLRTPGAIQRKAAALCLASALAYAAWLGAAARIPVGANAGAYLGVDRVAAMLGAQPPNAVIYYRQLGWHYDFYLFDAPQERRWYRTPWKLGDDAGRTARTEPGRPQWLALADSEKSEMADLHLALATHGLELSERGRVGGPRQTSAFTLYRVVPLAGERSP